MTRDVTHQRLGFWVALVVLVATVVQLAVGALVPGIERFEDKAFGYRLVLNTVLMLAVPTAWWVARRRRPGTGPVPWWASALIASSFLFDAAGNSLDLYDTWDPFDAVSHAVTWFLLLWGVGLLLLRADVRPGWALATTVIGLGAILAIGWEVGEWYTFIRRGFELDGAYEDTLSDLVLGVLGSTLAAVVVEVARRRRAPRAESTSH